MQLLQPLICITQEYDFLIGTLAGILETIKPPKHVIISTSEKTKYKMQPITAKIFEMKV